MKAIVESIFMLTLAGSFIKIHTVNKTAWMRCNSDIFIVLVIENWIRYLVSASFSVLFKLTLPFFWTYKAWSKLMEKYPQLSYWHHSGGEKKNIYIWADCGWPWNSWNLLFIMSTFFVIKLKQMIFICLEDILLNLLLLCWN